MIIFKNVELFSSREELRTFCKEAYRLVDLKSLHSNNIEIEVSKRCKRVAGNIKVYPTKFVSGKIDFTKDLTVKINVSYDYYKTFGIERSIATLRHEFAHLVDYTLTGKCSHGHTFKRICVELGGSMNQTMAGFTYSASATDQYIKRTYKWKYTCPGCGHVTEKVRKFSDKTKERYSCLTCRTKVKFFKEESIK